MTDQRSDSAEELPAANDVLTCADADTSDLVTRLRARVSELEQALQRVTEERDEALTRLEQSGLSEDASSGKPYDGFCHFCHGEGTYWVHDFEMTCKRCNGTGRHIQAE